MSINLGSMPGIQPANTQPTGTPAAAGQLPAFADYSAGDTFKAEVTGVKGETVTMQTPAGAEFTTEFPQGLSVNPGDVVDMALVSKNANGVNLKPVAINGQPIQLESNELQAFLMDNGIAPSKMNEGAAQVLVNYHIAPTPRNVAQLVQVATALPEIPTSVAVTMAQNQIPPTQDNANALMQLTAQPAVLGQDIATLSGMVENGADGQIFSQVFPQVVAESATPEQMQTMDRSGLQQLAGQIGEQIQQQGLENMTPRQVQSAIHQYVQQLPAAPEQRAAIEQVLTQAFTQTSEAVQSEVQPQQAAAPQAPAPETAPAVQAGAQDPAIPVPEGGAEQTAAVPQQTQAAETQSQQAAPQTAVPVPNAEAQAPAAQAPTQTAQPPVGQTQAQTGPAQAAETPVPTPAPETAGSRQPAENQAPQAAPERTEPGQARLQSAPAAETGTAAENRPVPTEARPEQPARGADALVQENPVRQEADKIMSDLGKMVVKVREGAVQDDAQALRNGVRDQQRLADMTKEGVARLFGSTSAAAQKANEMSSQVRVGSQMDQFYYAQVPFQTQQMEGTADLYVFQRQGQKAERERTHITVLIGLDTPHMGRVESVLRSRDERLSVEFRVSSKRVQTFFENALYSFREQMRDIGFPLESATVSQIGEKVTPVNAMRVMEPKQEIRLRGLDIEA